MNDLFVDPFDRFWKIYPPRKNSSKKKAREKFQNLSKIHGVTDIIQGAKRYAEDCKGKDPQYIAHAATWLHQQRWETSDIDDKAPSAVLNGLQAPDTHEEWIRLLLRGLPLKENSFCRDYCRGYWPLGREGMGPNPFFRKNNVIPQSVWDIIGPVWGWEK